ncbi:ABC transporter permease [bacterium]|nr:ABC transporter permease [bacterium]
MRWFFEKLFRHRTAFAGMVIVAVFVLAAMAAPLLAPHSPIVQFKWFTRLAPSVLEHAAPVDETGQTSIDPATGQPVQPQRFLLGTDFHGRDILSRIIHGAQVSLLVGVVATLIALFIGIIIGSLAGYFGGWMDNALMRLTDTFFAFPSILLAIVILATFRRPGIWALFIALGFTGWTGIARVIRGQILSLKEQEFVEAARSIGASNLRIITRHLLPNCLAPIIVLGTLAVAENVLSEAGLSFLGIGIQPPTPSWGNMLAEARGNLVDMPWWGVFPGLALALTVLGFNLFGDGLRDILDPRLRIRR